MTQSKGRFIWHELMTTDVDAAKAYYTEVIGWKTQAFEGGPGDYTMFVAGERPMGGIMELPKEAVDMGAPPHWLGHIQVDDVAAIVSKTRQLGGTVYKDTETIPTVGTFAVLADPQGATFAVFQPEAQMEPRDRQAPGEVGWNELNSTDWEAAWKFYSELFGWKKTDQMDMGEGMGTYFMFTTAGDENSMGGMSSVAKTMNLPPHWLHYVNVDDIDGAAERITKHGGKILNGPMEVPGGGKIAQCQDPQGVAFAVYAEK